MFEDAMRDEIVSKNPIRLASQLSTRNRVKEVDDVEPFTMEQIQKLISTCENQQMKNLYMFCLEDSKITVEDSAHLWRQQYSWNIWNLMQRFQDGATMNGRIYING
jgi:hypothetical protein